VSDTMYSGACAAGRSLNAKSIDLPFLTSNVHLTRPYELFSPRWDDVQIEVLFDVYPRVFSFHLSHLPRMLNKVASRSFVAHFSRPKTKAMNAAHNQSTSSSNVSTQKNPPRQNEKDPTRHQQDKNPALAKVRRGCKKGGRFGICVTRLAEMIQKRKK
jgi:hypothetical protein